MTEADKKKALMAASVVVWIVQGLYTVSPIDVIPDFIPVVGWMDDAFGLFLSVVVTVIAMLYAARQDDGGTPKKLPGGRGGGGKMKDAIDVEYEPMSRAEIEAL